MAAIIIEPVQGEGGFHVAPTALLKKLREICDTHGILLIADEIQSGFGRTGRMFAIQHSGVEPDLVTLAKSLAGGFPCRPSWAAPSIMDSVGPGGLGRNLRRLADRLRSCARGARRHRRREVASRVPMSSARAFA